MEKPLEIQLNDETASAASGGSPTGADLLSDRLVEQDPFLSELTTLLRSGEVRSELRRTCMIRVIDEVWLGAVESALPALDRVLRKPSRFIKETERVLPIEQSRNITARSIRDLAVHSDYIKEVSDDRVVPSKILNVFRDETMETYENRFVNTLVNRLYLFVDKRYKLLRDKTGDVKTTSLDLSSGFASGALTGTVHLTVEVSEPPTARDTVKGVTANASLWKRVEKLRDVVLGYQSGEFCKSMGNDFVRPPIMRTNALLKNPDLRECLALWEFIESYEKAGFESLSEEKTETADEAFVGELLKTAALQYALFRKETAGNEQAGLGEFREYHPDLIPQIEDEESEVFDIRDSVYRKVVRVFRGGEDAVGTPTPDEERICDAITVALKLAETRENRRLTREKFAEGGSLSGALRYRRSFLSKVIQGGDSLQAYYSGVKNALLSFTGVKPRMSWSYESFTVGRKTCAKLQARGKTLVLYLALDPSQFETKQYRHSDASGTAQFRDVPLAIKLNTEKALQNAEALIAALMEQLGREKTDARPVDYRMPYETTEALVEKGLIKLCESSDEGQPDPAAPSAEDLSVETSAETSAETSSSEAPSADASTTGSSSDVGVPTQGVSSDTAPADVPAAEAGSEGNPAAEPFESGETAAPSGEVQPNEASSAHDPAQTADSSPAKTDAIHNAISAANAAAGVGGLYPTRDPDDMTGASPVFFSEQKYSPRDVAPPADPGAVPPDGGTSDGEPPQMPVDDGIGDDSTTPEEIGTDGDGANDSRPSVEPNAQMEHDEQSDKLAPPSGEQPSDETELLSHHARISDSEEILKFFSREEIDGVIERIRQNTATSAMDRVEGEVLLCYKILSRFGPFRRKRFLGMLESDDMATMLRAKDMLLKLYFDETQKK